MTGPSTNRMKNYLEMDYRQPVSIIMFLKRNNWFKHYFTVGIVLTQKLVSVLNQGLFYKQPRH